MKIRCQVTSLVASSLASSLTGSAGETFKIIQNLSHGCHICQETDFHDLEPSDGNRRVARCLRPWVLHLCRLQGSCWICHCWGRGDLTMMTRKTMMMTKIMMTTKTMMMTTTITTATMMMMSQASCFVMGMELVGPTKRTLAGILCWWQIIIILIIIIIIIIIISSISSLSLLSSLSS